MGTAQRPTGAVRSRLTGVGTTISAVGVRSDLLVRKHGRLVGRALRPDRLPFGPRWVVGLRLGEKPFERELPVPVHLSPRSATTRMRQSFSAIALSLLTASTVLAVAEPIQSSYTSESTCNAGNTAWTVTNTCCCDVGAPSGSQTPSQHFLHGGVQYAPASAGPPTVTITDSRGQPIFVGGALLVMEPSDQVTQKVTGEQGLISPDHVWAGFQSNVLITPPVGTTATVYKITYSWPVPVAVTGATWFSDNGDDINGDTVIDGFNLIPLPPGTPVLDGVNTGEYPDELSVQGIETQFGNSNLGAIDYANGSELNGAYGYIDPEAGTLRLLLSGNLESNFNKLEVFFDYRDGGQNRLRGDNPDVDFNGLNRMGDDGSGNGLTFERGFAADFYLTLTCGGGPFATFANTARLNTNGGGIGGFIGTGGAGSGSVLYGINGVAIAINNSNVDGVGGGTGIADGSGVKTGVEMMIPLITLKGYTGGDIKVTAFINAGGHDFVSNQVLGGLAAGTGNLGEPRNVNFAGLPGAQCFTLVAPSAPCTGDFDGNGAVDGADLAVLLGSWGGGGGDLNGDGVTDGADLATLLGAWGGCP